MSIIKQFENLPDADVIREIISGKVALYEILIRRSNPFLYRVGRTYGYNHEDVQDLMQDSFVNAYINLPKFRNQSTFKTWITRIMINNCYAKKQKFSYKNEMATEKVINEKSTPMFSSQSSKNTDKSVLNKELSRVIEQAIEKIPLDYRMVFSLREINGMNVAETAEALDITEANVKVRLNRAKEMLRNEIEKMYSPADIYEFNLIYCDLMVNRVMNELNAKHIAQ